MAELSVEIRIPSMRRSPSVAASLALAVPAIQAEREAVALIELLPQCEWLLLQLSIWLRGTITCPTLSASESPATPLPPPVRTVLPLVFSLVIAQHRRAQAAESRTASQRSSSSAKTCHPELACALRSKLSPQLLQRLLDATRSHLEQHFPGGAVVPTATAVAETSKLQDNLGAEVEWHLVGVAYQLRLVCEASHTRCEASCNQGGAGWAMRDVLTPRCTMNLPQLAQVVRSKPLRIYFLLARWAGVAAERFDHAL